MAIVLDGNNLTTTGMINSLTAVNSTSGTSIDFTGIPTGVKRVTIMLNGVSLNANSIPLIQIGAGSVQTTGYSATAGDYVPTANFTSSTAGFPFAGNAAGIGAAGNFLYGQIVLTNLSGNLWCSAHSISSTGAQTNTGTGAGTVTLSGALDRVRITSVAGTATFDAGSINVLYE